MRGNSKFPRVLILYHSFEHAQERCVSIAPRFLRGGPAMRPFRNGANGRDTSSRLRALHSKHDLQET